MCVHQSVQDLEIYSIINKPVPISEDGGMLGRAIVGCPSNAHLRGWYLSAPVHHLCLQKFVPCVCIDQIYHIISMPVPLPEAGGILGRAVVCCP